jgi:hypothetical protein
MAKSYTSLIVNLKDKLSAMTVNMTGSTTTTSLFVGVYTSPEIIPAGYPCAFILDEAGSGNVLDMARNAREWQFGITLYQESQSKSIKDAVPILRTITDAVISAFDKDPYLTVSGLAQCQYIKVVPTEFDYHPKENPWVFARFIISIVDVVNNY